FELNDPCNVVRIDPVVHKSLDPYALIAVTGTSETLRRLSSLIKAGNEDRQKEIDSSGEHMGRSFRLFMENPTFRNPEYQLLVLHPEHFLPAESVFTSYDPSLGTHKAYCPSPDRLLREYPSDLSQSSPPFYGPDGPKRQGGLHLNPLLVILNTDIKFRRYHRLPPPSQFLPEDVLDLMKQTEELTNLIYRELKATPGSAGEGLRKERDLSRRVNEERAARRRAKETKIRSAKSGAAVDAVAGRTPGRYFPWPEGADSETRMEMGMALLSGRSASSFLLSTAVSCHANSWTADLEFTSEDEVFLESLHAVVFFFYFFRS
ncbi:hypothetical protein BDN70DRAFT_942737, partial [Pholiota conissans]